MSHSTRTGRHVGTDPESMGYMTWKQLKKNDYTYEKNDDFFIKDLKKKKWRSTDVVIDVFLCKSCRASYAPENYTKETVTIIYRVRCTLHPQCWWKVNLSFSFHKTSLGLHWFLFKKQLKNKENCSIQLVCNNLSLWKIQYPKLIWKGYLRPQGAVKLVQSLQRGSILLHV